MNPTSSGGTLNLNFSSLVNGMKLKGKNFVPIVANSFL